MADTTENDANKPKPERRKIPGNLPYTAAPGALKRALEKIPTTEKPSIFNVDFLSTVLEISGGSARPIPPILKAAGLISGSGAPTELYSQFQTENGRPSAALEALKKGYVEVFRRNQFAHKADEKGLTDIIVAVTGLPKTDNVVRCILSTFQTFQVYAKEAREASSQPSERAEKEPDNDPTPSFNVRSSPESPIELVYNINIVLPETSNIEVYNSIFKSIKGNLLS